MVKQVGFKLPLIVIQVFILSATFSTALFAEEASLKISKLMLVDPVSDQIVRELSAEETIDLGTLPSGALNISAITKPESVSRVVFSVNQIKRFREETGAPYALAGNNGPDFKEWKPRAGNYKITVTPFLGERKGESFELSLTMSQGPEVKAGLKRETEQVSLSESTLSEDEAKEGLEEETEPAAEAASEHASNLGETLSKDSEIATESAKIVEPPVMDTTLPKDEGIGALGDLAKQSEEQQAKAQDARDSQQMNEDESVNQAELQSKDQNEEESEAPRAKLKRDDEAQSKVPLGKTFSFSLSDTQVSPPTRSASFGTCSALMDEENGEAIFGCTHSVMSPKAAFASFVRGSDDQEVTWCGFESAETPITAECPLSSEVRQALLEGRLFVTITSEKYPTGEIRGLVRSRG